MICEGALSDAFEDFLHDENGEMQNILIYVYIASLLCPTVDVDPKWKDFKESNGLVLTIENNEC